MGSQGVSGGPESHKPRPHSLSGDDELVDVWRVFDEQVGGAQRGCCGREQQPAVYHLRENSIKHTLHPNPVASMQTFL